MARRSHGRAFGFILLFAWIWAVISGGQPRILKYLELNPPWLDFAPWTRAIAFSADDNYLAAADLNGPIHLWKRNWQNQYVYRYSWYAAAQPALFAFSPSSASQAPLLAVSVHDDTEFWRLGSVTPQEITPSDLKETTFVQFSGDGRFVFVNKGEHLKAFDWQRREFLDLPHPIPRAWSISEDGSVLITVDNHTYVSHLWDARALLGFGNLHSRGKEITTFGKLKRDALLQNYPNPFNPETWIPYRLGTPAEVVLAIYDTNGQKVRTLDIGHQPSGAYESRERAAYWDGRNQRGETAASGVYYYTLRAGDFSAMRKMIVGK